MNTKGLWIFLSFLGLCAHVAYAEEEEFVHSISAQPVSAFNLNFNSHGNTINARSGEKVFSTLNFSFENTLSDPDALYQIVIGYEGLGPQKCVFNEFGYRFAGKEGILSFFFEAPEDPGVYNVQGHIVSARSSIEALQNWWSHSEEEVDRKIVLGKIIVK
jgi:hypothetical protein